jgi:NAD(P)-dependent dehydrogenase (short-subunit alcohol dehydrogenase family)
MPRPARLPSHPVALVTGASSGIGEASARRLARRGFRVVLAARRGDRLESGAKDIAHEGGNALPLVCDLADSDATSQLVERTLGVCGRVDVLVNNAGFSPGAALEQVSRQTLRHIFDVNLFAGLQLIAELVPTMRAQGGGRIINMGSLGGSIAAPLAVPYGGSKAALDIATRALRLELAPFRIHVSQIVPGFVDTAVFENARAGSEHLRADPDNPYRQLFHDLDELSKKKLEGALSPDDIAKVVERVATASRPRPRYYAPLSAHLQSRFLGLLPERWLDQILSRVYKIGA